MKWLYAVTSMGSTIAGTLLLSTAYRYATTTQSDDQPLGLHVSGPYIYWHVGIGLSLIALGIVLAVLALRRPQRTQRSPSPGVTP